MLSVGCKAVSLDVLLDFGVMTKYTVHYLEILCAEWLMSYMKLFTYYCCVSKIDY